MKLSYYITFEHYSIDEAIITKATLKLPMEIFPTTVQIMTDVNDYLTEPKGFKRRRERDAITALFSALADRVITEMGLEE